MTNPHVSPAAVTTRKSVGVGAALCTGALLLLGGCTSGTALIRPPTAMTCPKAAQEDMVAHQLRTSTGPTLNSFLEATIEGADSHGYLEVSQGTQITAVAGGSIPGAPPLRIPQGTIALGRVILGGYKGPEKWSRAKQQKPVRAVYLWFDRFIYPGSAQSIAVCYCQVMISTDNIISGGVIAYNVLEFPRGCDGLGE